MEEFIELQVSYILNEREQKAFAELLPYLRQYAAEDGSKPYEHWEIKDAFEKVMTFASPILISRRIKEVQFHAGMIDVLELVNGKMFRLEEFCIRHWQMPVRKL